MVPLTARRLAGPSHPLTVSRACRTAALQRSDGGRAKQSVSDGASACRMAEDKGRVDGPANGQDPGLWACARPEQLGAALGSWARPLWAC